MPIKQVVCCDKCGKMIEDSISHIQGFVFVGNVNVVDSNEEDGIGGGIVGNNLIPLDTEDHEDTKVVNSVLYYCRSCTVEVLFGAGYELKAKDPVLRDPVEPNRWPR